MKPKEQIVRDLDVLIQRVKFIADAEISLKSVIVVASEQIEEKIRYELVQTLRHLSVAELVIVIEELEARVFKEENEELVPEPTKKKRGRPFKKDLN